MGWWPLVGLAFVGWGGSLGFFGGIHTKILYIYMYTCMRILISFISYIYIYIIHMIHIVFIVLTIHLNDVCKIWHVVMFWGLFLVFFVLWCGSQDLNSGRWVAYFGRLKALFLIFQAKIARQGSKKRNLTLQGTNLSHLKVAGKMMFLF